MFFEHKIFSFRTMDGLFAHVRNHNYWRVVALWPTGEILNVEYDTTRTKLTYDEAMKKWRAQAKGGL